MQYPTLAEVETASREQLGRWCRFLPSPGSSAVGSSAKNFQALLDEQVPIMNLIYERFTKMGMFTPELSKSIGWDDWRD
jgi:hypothetical protein